MRQDLIERVPLICPRCRHPQALSILRLTPIAREGAFVLQGMLNCPADYCQSRYPVVRGVPVICKDMLSWWRAERDKLSAAAVAGELRDYFAALDALSEQRHAERCLLSTYMDAHYGDSAMPYWRRLTHRIQGATYRLALDLGSSVGRFAFELSRVSELAVGLDLNFSLVAAAAEIQRNQAVEYSQRRRGRTFRHRRIPFAAPQNTLFLVADALDPPFPAETFDMVAALNLVDNVAAPTVLLGQMDALLAPGGTLLCGSPYEWRSDISESGEWLENEQYDAATLSRALLTGDVLPQMQLNYRIADEIADLAWTLRHHDRYRSVFSVHLLKAYKYKE